MHICVPYSQPNNWANPDKTYQGSVLIKVKAGEHCWHENGGTIGAERNSQRRENGGTEGVNSVCPKDRYYS